VKESDQNGLVLCVGKPQKKAKSSNVKDSENRVSVTENYGADGILASFIIRSPSWPK
jgi:hypothetical protein